MQDIRSVFSRFPFKVGKKYASDPIRAEAAGTSAFDGVGSTHRDTYREEGYGQVFTRRNDGEALPLGVDLSPSGVSIVAASIRHGEFVVTEVHSEKHAFLENDEHQTEAIKVITEVVHRLKTRQRSCILALDGTEVKTISFEKLRNASKNQLDGFANIQADRYPQFAEHDRAFSIDPLGSENMLLSIAKKSQVTRLANLARTAGLKPIAVDTAWCAWQRALPDIHAVLDARSEKPILCVFARDVRDIVVLGGTYTFPAEVTDELIASKIGNAFMEKRRDSGFDVQSLAVAATPERYEKVAAELMSIGGFTVSPIAIGAHVLPEWGLAFGLATWNLPEASSA